MQKYRVTGMTCAACQARVEKAVGRVPGVRTCAVSLLTHSMGVEGDADPSAVITAVEQAGYGATVESEAAALTGTASNRTAAVPPGTAASRAGGASRAAKGVQAADPLADRESPVLLRRLFWSLGALATLMYLSMGHVMWGAPLPSALAENPMAIGLCQLLLTAAVMVINQKFFVSGARGLWRLSPNMDTLVALGASAAFGYSTFVLFRMSAALTVGDMAGAYHGLHDLYFESAAMILSLITVGKLLEARAKGKTTDALRTLMSLTPDTATLVRDGVETVVPVAEVRVGDHFAVRAGERIPVDGTVLSGGGAVDEAALSGESIPVDKTMGDRVSAATVNRSGYLLCEATRVGEDTTLAGIIRLMSDAATTKAPIAKVADRVAGVFVPVVMGIALVTVAAWLLAGQTVGYALARGISVLVISCPCALGLATPVAIMVGSGVGARHGILFKTAVSLESAGRVRTVVLDKTGTVTEGRPRLTDLCTVRGRDDLLPLAHSLESMSEHPLSVAVTEYGHASDLTPLPVTDFETLPGRGLRGRIDGQLICGGNRAFVEAMAPIPAEAVVLADAWAAEGKTPLYFAADDRFLGALAVADTVKPDSREAIRELQDMGLRVVMLTGDNARTAAAVARAAGVEEVIADVLPDGKEAAVHELMATGKVAMVGDGINDAPALTRADVGMAIGAGADVAIDAADVVVVRSRLSDVVAAIRLGRATLWNIRENLFWAFIYNVIGIPLAAGLYVSWLGWEMDPMFGAAAMSLSSFCVVTNALRLNWVNLRWKTRRPAPAKANSEPLLADGVEPVTVSIEIPYESEYTTMKKTIKIDGMMCPRCEAHVKKALLALDGVTEATADHTVDLATVTLSTSVSDEAIKAAVEEEGYTVLGIE